MMFITLFKKDSKLKRRTYKKNSTNYEKHLIRETLIEKLNPKTRFSEKIKNNNTFKWHLEKEYMLLKKGK